MPLAVVAAAAGLVAEVEAVAAGSVAAVTRLRNIIVSLCVFATRVAECVNCHPP